MTTHLSELCSLLVQDLYGSLPSTIFSTVYRHGRLDLPQIHSHTRLPLNLIRHNLPILIQQGLILYDANDRRTYYEVNERAAYNLIRLGKNSKLIEDNFGTEESRFTSNLQLLGFATGEEASIQQGFESHDHDKSRQEPVTANGAPKVNGVKASSVLATVPDSGQVVKISPPAVDRLAQAQYVLPVQDIDFMPETDIRLNIIEEVKSRPKFHGKIPQTGKDKGEFWTQVTEQRFRKRKAAELGDLGSDSDSHIDGIKPNKRKKVNGVAARASIAESSDDEVDNHRKRKGKKLWSLHRSLRINHDKFDVAYRNQRLIALASRSLGEPTSKVYKAVLDILEAKLQRCYDPLREPGDQQYALADSPSVTVKEVYETLTLSDYGILSLDTQVKPTKPVKSKKEQSLIAEPSSTGEVEIHNKQHLKPNGIKIDAPKAADPAALQMAVEEHLRLLSEPPHRLVHRSANGLLRVDFTALSKRLVQSELETIVSSRFGNLAARLVRILYQRGKLDEKQLASVGLVRQKEVRALLASMQESGYIETQEVPRDLSRQPNRTIYLWSFDQDRCKAAVLDQTYKAMSRLLQRRNLERGKLQRLLDKAARKDVLEEDLLSREEKQALEDWEKMEETFLLQVERCDDLVMVLRDFLPVKSPS